MNLNIKATNFELTPEIKGYVQEKMDMLEKYLGDIQVVQANFEVALSTRHHNKGEIYCAECNLQVPNKLIRVVKTEKDLYKAIDKVKDHLKVSIGKYKEKLIDGRKKADNKKF